MIPLRFIGEALGADVKWDGKNRIVNINQNSEDVFFSAIRDGEINKVEKLLQEGINPNAQNDSGWTALSMTDNIDILKLLIDNGADPNIKSVIGATALWFAVSRDNFNNVVFLLEAGANPNIGSNGDGLNTLMLAAANGYYDIAKELISGGVNVNFENDGGTAFFMALYEGHETIAQLIVDSGFDPSTKNSLGFTPLMYASYGERVDMVKFLLKLEVDPTIQEDGTTALDFAKNNNNVEIIELIERAISSSSTQENKEVANTLDKYITTVSELKTFLDENYSSVDTSLGTTKFKFSIIENETIMSAYDFWIMVNYESDFFYDLKYSNKITNEQREKVKSELKDHQEKIGKAVIERMPDKKFLGGYYDSWYRYPNLEIDLITRQYYSWTNFDGSIADRYEETKPSTFRWWDLLDNEL